MRMAVSWVLAGWLFAAAPSAAAEETAGQATRGEEGEATDEKPLEIYERVEVRERGDDLVGIASSATEGVIGRADLEQRPILRPGDLVETAPGVIATQHSGGGKANQYFLRGFNLDHGTDFSLSVGGVPVNLPTHGHGQGYADLNFLIPELVASARYRKGPYFADKGDFSAAGGVDMELVRSLPERIVSVTGGSYDLGRLLYAESFQTAGGDLLAAVDLFRSDGPWTRGDDYDGGKAVLRFNRGDATRGFSVTAVGYDATWLATDQVPRRSVEAGLIGRFDFVDVGPRGSAARYSLAGELHRGRGGALTSIGGYLLYSDFDLVSNFTYFLQDPESGDQFEQLDRRSVAGIQASRSWLASWGGRRVENTAGIQLRFDDIENGLHRTRALERIGSVREDRIQQLGGGPYFESIVRWSDRVRTRAGLRADFYQADVKSKLAVNSGTADDLLLSPKLSLVLGPWKNTEVYLNFGYGFHSNDARGATIRVDPVTGKPSRPVEPLVSARGADVGLRTTRLSGLQTTLSLFALELDSELVFVGDGGATEASRPSRRLGVEWANFWRLSERLSIDLDVAFTDAQFTDRDPAGDEIPGAIDQTVAAGVSWSGPHGLSASLRWRYFAGAPLLEDGSVRSGSSSLVNGQVGYRLPCGLFLGLEVFNVFDREVSDIEYFYASRLPGEPAGGVEDIHFHPAEPRSLRLTVRWQV